MPKPTIQQIFGDNASVSQGGILTVNFADFAAVGWDTASGVQDAEKWLTAIILKSRAFSLLNTDELPNINTQEPYPGLIMRNNILKREYSYTIQIYAPDTSASLPDPDVV